MVRSYRRKTATVYTSEQLQAAIKAVGQGEKLCVAARKFNVPVTTLLDHVKKRVCAIGAGHPTVLTKKEEEEIVAIIQALQEIGFGLTKELVGVVIRDYLKDQSYRPNPFKDGVPGKEWWQLFMKRWHSKISVRKPQHLPTNRAVSASEEVLDAWFQRVKDLFKKTGLDSLSPDELRHYI